MGKKDITQKSVFEDAERFADLMNAACFGGDEILCGFRRSDRLYPVYTLVLYWGEKEWDAKDSLQEIVEIPLADVRMERKLKEMLPDWIKKVHFYCQSCWEKTGL